MLAVDSTTSVNTSTQAYLSTTIAVLASFVLPMNVRSLRNLEITSYDFFFKAVDLPIDGREPINFGDMRAKFLDFAEYLFNNFFLPVKASTKKTPQPSPALHSAVQEAQGHSGQQYVGTGPRLSALRRDCLVRDRHRCVISRKFDFSEAVKRSRAPGGPQDDEGNLIANDPIEPAPLEVAHILPHSLTKANENGELVRRLTLLHSPKLKSHPGCF
ncbi:hypothetical protein EKO27_g5661 [Xylaria grammica]|uniref:HNH nuclease domain-containing protein n=1 Tax=Xylaria grammica TaxID=363999 RepID=A0A439D4Y0_9PEZI|nr:hypothetical protein EKO27_g5661 [Xylaria grammica]